MRLQDRGEHTAKERRAASERRAQVQSALVDGGDKGGIAKVRPPGGLQQSADGAALRVRADLYVLSVRTERYVMVYFVVGILN